MCQVGGYVSQLPVLGNVADDLDSNLLFVDPVDVHKQEETDRHRDTDTETGK